MKVKATQATSIIAKLLRAKLVPMLTGSPGVGKSSIIHSIATEYNLKVIDVRLSQSDPTDLMGFPSIKGNKAGYLPMETFPLEGDAVPEGFNGWLLFFDEFNSASPAVQAAAYKIILDRMIGQHNLHKNVAIVCAGNLETDNAIVNPMSTAMQSRLVHLELICDAKEWINWANSNNVDHRLISYVEFKPGVVNGFTPDHTDQTYSCPRTLAFANQILGVTDIEEPDALPMLAGALSEGVARELVTFCKLDKDLPKIHDIEANPTGIPMPREPSILYALSGSISHHANMNNFTALMKFIKRMPAEFQVVCLKATVRRNREMLAHEAIQSWVSSSANTLF